jgi:hypothetical protein
MPRGCDPNLSMKDFTPSVGKVEKWLLAQFNICLGNAMDDPSTTTTVDWGDGSPIEPVALGDWLHGSPDIYGTHMYSTPGTYTVAVRMEATCHYNDGLLASDYTCVAEGFHVVEAL